MSVRRFQFLILLIELTIISCSFNSIARAQSTTLKGTITDAESGQILPGANVVVTSAQVQTGTAAFSNGEFEIHNLPSGIYTVIVTFIGYEKSITPDLTLADGETKSIQISLKPTGIQVNPVIVTASRRPEKLLDAPASITVLESSTIESRTALTATEHLKALPAVDIITAGLNQSRVVIRGFNDLLSGSLLSLIDYRITRIPAIRLNAFQLIPTSNDDIERIEVVSGPASALYGPNSANGVMHVITKSPFDSKGTKVSVGGGERNVLIGTIRHAGVFSDKIGYKFSVQHYKGRDFESNDPVEDRFLKFEKNPESSRIADRKFDIESTTFDSRLDFRFSKDFSFIINSGFSQGDNIEITNQGAAQALDAAFYYLQGRLSYKNLFIQAFLNKIKTGDTYFLRTGQTVINNSSLSAIQAQHNFSLNKFQNFIYGLDVLLTRPDTEGTVNGLNENHDNVKEIGAFLQSETALSSKLKLVSAARIDDHDRLKGINISPRAAIVYKPTPVHNFRFTYNRAFTTPTSDMLFSDILGGTQPSESRHVPFFGDTFMNIRSLGTWPNGFHFNYGNNGRPQMMASFVGYDDYLAPDVNSVWPALRALIISGTDDGLQKSLLESYLPRILSKPVPGVLKVIDTESPEGNFIPVNSSFVRDIEPVSESTNTTFEMGFKGLLNKKLLASIDIYHSKINDFIAPLSVVTPNVFIDPDSLESVILKDIIELTYRRNNLFDQIVRAQAPALARYVAQNDSLAMLPLGVISPVEIMNGKDVFLTYRNLGDISVSGMDLSLTYFLNRNWNLTGNYSYVNKDLFISSDGDSISLNAPKHKIGAIINYINTGGWFNGNLRIRFIDGFQANSGVFKERVERYTVLDLNTSFILPFSHNTRLTLTVQNLMNNKHKEFAGVPEIGRLAWMRLTQLL